MRDGESWASSVQARFAVSVATGDTLPTDLEGLRTATNDRAYDDPQQGGCQHTSVSVFVPKVPLLPFTLTAAKHTQEPLVHVGQASPPHDTLAMAEGRNEVRRSQRTFSESVSAALRVIGRRDHSLCRATATPHRREAVGRAQSQSAVRDRKCPAIAATRVGEDTFVQTGHAQ